MKNIYLLYSVQFFSTFNIYKIILTLFYQANGMDLIKIGIILTFSYLSKVVFEVPTGYLADRFGKKKVVSIGLFLFVVFLASTYIFRNYYVFIIASFLQGLSLTLVSGAIDAIQYEGFIAAGKKDEVVKYSAYERFILLSAFGFSGLFGGILSDYSYDIVFIINIFISLLAAIIFLFVDDTQNITSSTQRHGDKFLFSCISHMIESPHIIKCMNVAIIISFAMIPIDNYYSLILKNDGCNESMIGVIYCIQFLISSLFGLLSSYLSLRFDKDKLLNLLPIVGFIFLIPFAISRSIIFALSSYTMLLIVIALLMPIRYSIMQGKIKDEYRSTIISIESLLIALTAIISIPIFSFLLDHIGRNLTIILFIIITTGLLFLNIKGVRQKENGA